MALSCISHSCMCSPQHLKRGPARRNTKLEIQQNSGRAFGCGMIAPHRSGPTERRRRAPREPAQNRITRSQDCAAPGLAAVSDDTRTCSPRTVPSRRRLSALRGQWLNGRDIRRRTRGLDATATSAPYMHGAADISSGHPRHRQCGRALSLSTGCTIALALALVYSGNMLRQRAAPHVAHRRRWQYGRLDWISHPRRSHEAVCDTH